MMKQPRVHMLKKVRSVPEKLSKKGPVCVRPVSFHMDKLIDKHVITGGGYEPIVTGEGKRHALKIAHARIRVIKMHQQRRKK